MSGVSGSGKSTYARKLWNELEPGTYCKVVSADDYFMVNGEYEFDSSKLSAAHSKCFRDYLAALQDDYSLVIVDNTNLTSEEISPYMLAASAFGYEAEVITLTGKMLSETVVMLSDRNLHGVSPNNVMYQHSKLLSRKLPPWWKETTIPIET